MIQIFNQLLINTHLNECKTSINSTAIEKLEFSNNSNENELKIQIQKGPKMFADLKPIRNS